MHKKVIAVMTMKSLHTSVSREDLENFVLSLLFLWLAGAGKARGAPSPRLSRVSFFPFMLLGAEVLSEGKLVSLLHR